MEIILNNASIFFETIGEGEPVFLIHGFPLYREMWRPQIEFLTKEGFKVVAIDLRGFGDSTANTTEWSMDDFGDDIINVANFLEIEKFSIAGMSMGGYITFNILDRFPERINKVILVATKAQADDEAGKAKRNELIELAKTKGPQAVIDHFKQILFAPLTWEKRPNLILTAHSIMKRSSLNGIIGALKAMRDRKDYVSLLPRIYHPTLIMHGLSDLASPIPNAKLMKEKIPNSILFESEIAGHMINLEDTKRFNEEILSFLRS